MKTLEEQFYEYAVVPVVVLDDADDAAPLAEALIKGGLPSAGGPGSGSRRKIYCKPRL